MSISSLESINHLLIGGFPFIYGLKIV